MLVGREDIQNILSKYNIIEEYNIKKIYPSTININITPTKFVARLSGNDLLVAANGKLIENKEKFLAAEYPLAYSRTILRNTFIDKCRKDSKVESLDELNLEPVIDENKFKSFEHQELMDCLKQHNEIDRTILAMKGAGHDYDVIQKFIGKISMGNLRTKTTRARTLLADCLGRKRK